MIQTETWSWQTLTECNEFQTLYESTTAIQSAYSSMHSAPEADGIGRQHTLRASYILTSNFAKLWRPASVDELALAMPLASVPVHSPCLCCFSPCVVRSWRTTLPCPRLFSLHAAASSRIGMHSYETALTILQRQPDNDPGGFAVAIPLDHQQGQPGLQHAVSAFGCSIKHSAQACISVATARPRHVYKTLSIPAAPSR